MLMRLGQRRHLCTLTLIVTILFAGHVSADAVWGKVLTARQPDGSTFKVKVFGDEFYRVCESLDGYTVVRDPESREWQYARLSADGTALEPTGWRVGSIPPALFGLRKHVRLDRAAVQATVQGRRRARRNSAPSTNGTKFSLDELYRGPTVGVRRGIVLMVRFADSSDEDAKYTKRQIEDFCNSMSYSQFGLNMSVRGYYDEISDSKLTFTNTVIDWYTAENTFDYYNDRSGGDRELILEALNHAENNLGFNFSTLDGNSDGTIDVVSCFYAGERPADWGATLWPHMSWNLDFSADDVSADTFQITDMGSDGLNLSTFCHEIGHALCGFPDLYDYGYDSRGIGNWCLMSGNTAPQPQYPNAFLRYKAGWLNPTMVTWTDLQTHTLEAEPEQALLYPNENNEKEYFILENRYQSGIDSKIPGSGLLVWHVDEDGNNDHQAQTASSHYMCTLVQADGKWDMEKNKNNGDSADPFKASGVDSFDDTTSPSAQWWDGTNSDFAFVDVSNSGQSMTLSVGGGGPVIKPKVTVTATDGAASEINLETGTFTISLDPAVTRTLPVSYAIGGTASNGVDYAELSGTVEVPPNTASVTVTVTPLFDTLIEGEETVTLTLTEEGSYTVGTPSSATVNIEDRGEVLPMVSVEVTDPQAAEYETDTGTFLLSFDWPAGRQFDLRYSVSGTAIRNIDYVALSGTSRIMPGQSSVLLTVIPKDDISIEPDETVTLTVLAGTGYEVGSNGSGTVTIVDDDSWRTYSITGTVKRETGEVMSGVYVDLFTAGGQWEKSVLTDTNGLYSLTGLSAGRYRVRAYDPADGYAATDYSGGIIAVGPSDAEGINIVFEPAYGISGSVTRQGGGAVPYAWLDLFSRAGTWLQNARADAEGVYSFPGVLPGSYRVCVYDPDANNISHGYGEVVQVVNEALTGVDHVLPVIYTVSGHVTLDGESAGGVWLDLFTTGGTWKGNTRTDELGNYTLGPVPAGTYNIFAYDPDDGECVAASINPLTLQATRTGVDFSFLSSYRLGGHLKHVGVAVSGAWLDLFTDTGVWVDHAQTDAAGAYSFPEVVIGSYLLLAYDPEDGDAVADGGAAVTLVDGDLNDLEVIILDSDTHTAQIGLADNVEPLALCKVPGGSFAMGSDGVPVFLTQDFYIGTTEVTQAQYSQYTANPSFRAGDDLPVERVSWNDAQGFVAWLNSNDVARPAGYVYRLPTEAEWEYACRSGSRTSFSHGESVGALDQYAWFGSTSGSSTHAVKGLKANFWGLHDMHGNVWEWCEDVYTVELYAGSAAVQTNPLTESGSQYRTVRGGGWTNSGADCSAVARQNRHPLGRSSDVGFRVVLVPATQ